MTDEQMVVLASTARAFREACECYVANGPHRYVAGFPRDCCNHVSFLLARYLREQGLGSSRYYFGNRKQQADPPGIETHGWLQFGDVIVDITADQLRGENRPVIVTRDDSLHSQYHWEGDFAYDEYMQLDKDQASHDEMYSGISAHLRSD